MKKKQKTVARGGRRGSAPSSRTASQRRVARATEQEPTRDQIAKEYAAALQIINVLRASNEELSTSTAELLKALRRLVDLLNDDLDPEQCAAWDAAAAAIAKAEGRS